MSNRYGMCDDCLASFVCIKSCCGRQITEVQSHGSGKASLQEEIKSSSKAGSNNSSRLMAAGLSSLNKAFTQKL
jgi:hypothetical protein